MGQVGGVLFDLGSLIDHTSLPLNLSNGLIVFTSSQSHTIDIQALQALPRLA
jgi:hypothetical protein